MVSQTYAFKQSQDNSPGNGFEMVQTGGATAVPVRCHRTMSQASLVVSPPLSLFGAMIMALLALPREIMMAGVVIAAPARLWTRRHRGA